MRMYDNAAHDYFYFTDWSHINYKKNYLTYIYINRPSNLYDWNK